MAARDLELGPTGETVRDNVKRLRLARDLTYAELSRQMEEIGRPIPTSGLRRIEAGERRVDVDDLIALATVLWVDPVTMLLPPVVTDTTIVLTSGSDLWGRQAVAFMRGVPPEVLAWRQALANPDDWQGERDAQGHPLPTEKAAHWRTHSTRVDPEIEKAINA